MVCANEMKDAYGLTETEGYSLCWNVTFDQQFHQMPIEVVTTSLTTVSQPQFQQVCDKCGISMALRFSCLNQVY